LAKIVISTKPTKVLDKNDF